MTDLLEHFHPLTARWFSSEVGTPTPVQTAVWKAVSEGRHVLASAPTGSGKTLAAFLWALDRLVTGDWSGGRVRILYISPLKALNNDVQRNLIHPLARIESVFSEEGRTFPPIRVLTRSGDTPGSQRRQMIRKPPEILITTPESLNILLTSKGGRGLLFGIRTVILDEVHALFSTKRGTHLITAVERLAPICGEFQRIALSATIRPMETVANFIGGFEQTGGAPGQATFRKRPVTVIRPEGDRKTELSVRFPIPSDFESGNKSRWPVLVSAFVSLIRENRSTLLFANSRGLVEKLTRLINEAADETTGEPAEAACPLAYSHHGSLAREIRLAVEKKLKKGELKAIVATSSLELGIDIGELDQVVLVQAPSRVAAALQRVGRSGHHVGGVSRASMFPTHGRDLVNSAVLAKSLMASDIEPEQPVEAPLDVLAQVLVSMTAAEAWQVDRLFDAVRTAWPYRHLSRKRFDLVIEMLAGRYADTRLRELRPRIFFDRVDGVVKARPGSALLVYTAGGTIPDRGYYQLRLDGDGARIGDLDEEFVWERRVGERFALGSGVWRIVAISHNDVKVVPAEDRAGVIPFWKGEPANRDYYFSNRIASFLEEANGRLDKPDFKKILASDNFLDESARQGLVEFLKHQREITQTDLPHRHHLLIEHYQDPENRADSKQVILHTLWGGRINRPFAMALARAWENNYGYHLETFADDDCILVLLPHDFGGADLFDLVTPENLEMLIREKLETTGFFGARFRENAGISLLLPKISFSRRMPLWLNRLRAKKLFDAVSKLPDFPVLLETWRTCLQDVFDLDRLRLLLDEISEGKIRIGEAVTASPSPFASGVIWQQTNKHMYEDDSLTAGRRSALSDSLISEVLGTSGVLPPIPEKILTGLDAKLKRTAPGYAPGSSDDLLDWVKERLLLAEGEWDELLAAMRRDHGQVAEDWIFSLSGKLVRVRPKSAAVTSVCAVECVPRLCKSLGDVADDLSIQTMPASDTTEPRSVADILSGLAFAGEENQEEEALPDFLRQWLSFYGPIQLRELQHVFGWGDDALDGIARRLEDLRYAVFVRFQKSGDAAEICETGNLEILLRLARKARRPAFSARPAASLPLFLARFQGAASSHAGTDGMERSMEQLFGYPAPASAWEEYILPARMDPYYGRWLDGLMRETDLMWVGCGREKILFSFPEDLELFSADAENDGASDDTTSSDADVTPPPGGRYSIFDIAANAGMDSETASFRIWEAAWQGRVTNDTFAAVRQGLLNRFAPEKRNRHPRRGRRGGFNRWKAARASAGFWFSIPGPEISDDLLRKRELQKDRARQLFSRYGIVFREILQRELPAFSWGRMFSILRSMELSGEIFSGHFFQGIQGLQFISKDAFRLLQEREDDDAVFWINAADPASLCGIAPDGLKQDLPARRPTTHLVYHGTALVLISEKNGARIEIRTHAENEDLPRYYEVFKFLVGREFNPRKYVRIKTVNGEPAVGSEYAASLTAFGFVPCFDGLELRKTYQ